MIGQSALEYLISHAWMFLAVIIVGAALYGLGIYSSANTAGKRHSGFNLLYLDDFKIDTKGNLTIVLGNRMGGVITVNNITAEYPKGQFHYTQGGECTSDTLTPGELCVQIIPGLSEQSPGTSLELEVNVNYTNQRTGISHTETGNLVGQAEPA